MEHSKEDLRAKYNETFLKFLEDMGQMLITYGTLENLSKELYGQTPENIDLTEIIDLDEVKSKLDDSDPEALKKIALVMFELMAISNKLQNLNALSPEDKIKVGNSLKEIAELLKTL